MINVAKYRNFNKRIHEHVHSHVHKQIGKHVLKHAHKVSHHVNKTHHSLMHIGELILVGSIGFMSLMFAGSSNLPNNTSFVYPLQKVSTLECRTLYRNDMPDSCKINLPIIHGANYAAYENDATYRSIYTALRAAPYSDSWNQKIGAHGGLDIATARGTPLYSIGDGEVYYAGRNSAYGNVVKIKYVYQGEIVYAVYAHMDVMDIKTGDKVTKGQRIGAVGNSGNTFGKLGGYHVHFEIDKDNHGRPAYSYTNCPDLSKGHYKIIQNGLCRTELFRYQYDPIRIFEANSTYVHPVAEDKSEEIIEDKTDEQTEENTEEIVDETTDNTETINLDNPQNDTIDKWEEIINKAEEETGKNTEEQVEENKAEVQPEETKPEEDTNIIEDTEEEQIEDIEETKPEEDTETKAEDLEEDKRLIDLDFDDIDSLAEHFKTLWDIEMRSELTERSLLLGETITLDIEVFKKGDKELKLTDLNSVINRFNGVLQVPFMLITTNDNIKIDVNYLKLITKGEAQVEITGNKSGVSNLIIEFGGKKIGILDINIQ